MDPALAKEAGGQDKYHEHKILLAKLKQDSKGAKQIYLEALDDWKEEDPEFWATHFPIGCRERCSTQLLGNLYNENKDLKTWAKEWMKSKNISENTEVAGLMTACASLDALFLTDRIKGAINHITTEKLCRRIFGIQAAFGAVREVSDWKRPNGAAGGDKLNKWKSKVDYAVWKRVDPEQDGLSVPFVSRAVEEEVRGEMERDARFARANLSLAGAER